MIEVDGSAGRSFSFPAGLEAAFSYYADAAHTLSMIPHISISKSYDDNRFRMLYSTIELGVYRVEIYCDIQVFADLEGRVLSVVPLRGQTPVKRQSGLYSLRAQGVYSSESIFSNSASDARIDYRMRLQARLPVPRTLAFMPSAILDGIASSITHRRIETIVEGFIQRSIERYPVS
jgi:hypothetical protein